MKEEDMKERMKASKLYFKIMGKDCDILYWRLGDPKRFFYFSEDDVEVLQRCGLEPTSEEMIEELKKASFKQIGASKIDLSMFTIKSAIYKILHQYRRHSDTSLLEVFIGYAPWAEYDQSLIKKYSELERSKKETKEFFDEYFPSGAEEKEKKALELIKDMGGHLIK